MEKYRNGNSVYIKNGTQENMILDYIKTKGSITNLEALIELGVSQAPARIWGLKKRGIKIKTRPKVVLNRYGQSVRIVEYFIEGETI
jgi:hypothetical protein